jgi:hypothetical protein
MEKLSINRDELYKMVWMVPNSQLSKRFNISNFKLRTICKKMDIPMPKVGYWQQLRYGKQVEIPDLPPEDSEIIISTIDLIPIVEKKVDRLVQLKDDIEENCKQYLKVKRKIVDADIVTIEVKKDIERSTPSHFGREKGYISTYRYPIRFFVTPENASRALCILDAFAKLIRVRNHNILLNGMTYEINIADQRYEFGIREKQIKRKRYEGDYAYNYQATGLLILSTGRYHLKREYIDGKLPLEKQLSLIVAQMEYQSELWNEELNKYRAEKVIEDEKKKIIQAELNKKEKERENFIELLKQAKRWHKANNLRKYIDSFEEVSLKNRTMSEEIRAWLVWARGKAEWYDPFINKKDSLLSDEDLQKL